QRLLHLRVAGQNSLVVNLPEPMVRDQEISLVVFYSGPVTSPVLNDTEALALAGQDIFPPPILPQRNFVLSNRPFWYPQNPIGDYATATLRITVPEPYVALATGVPNETPEVRLRDLLTLPAGSRVFEFEATQPLRYLALVISRFERVADTMLTTPEGDELRLAVHAQPRHQGRGRSLLPTVEEIARFYAGLLGDAPYESMAL